MHCFAQEGSEAHKTEVDSIFTCHPAEDVFLPVLAVILAASRYYTAVARGCP